MQPTLIEAPIRISVTPNRRNDIQNYGDGNVYPQVIRNAFKASGRATQCIRVFEKFIRGQGFADPFCKTIVNNRRLTVDKLHRRLVKDYARYYGFAIHFNFNALGEIVSMDPIPFEELRLSIANDDGEVTEVAHHPDWGCETDTRFKADQVKRYKMFNPDPEIVKRQAEKAGGWEKYTGQILWWSINGNWKYPEASCDPVLEDVLADTESKEFRLSNITTGFMNPTMIETPPFENQKDRDNFIESIKQVQGGRNASKVILAEKKNNGEAGYEAKQIQVNSNDGNFEKTEQSSRDAIRSNYMIPTPLASDTIPGQLGVSQQLIQDSYASYNANTSDDRMIFEEVFAEIFKYWKDQSLNVGENFIIKELQFGEERILVERLGVGGTQAMQLILSDTVLLPQQKREILMQVFGLTEENALKMIPEGAKQPKPIPNE